MAGDLDGYAGSVIRDWGHLRWKIENNAFNELTQAWHLTPCAHHHPVALQDAERQRRSLAAEAKTIANTEAPVEGLRPTLALWRSNVTPRRADPGRADASARQKNEVRTFTRNLSHHAESLRARISA